MDLRDVHSTKYGRVDLRMRIIYPCLLSPPRLPWLKQDMSDMMDEEGPNLSRAVQVSIFLMYISLDRDGDNSWSLTTLLRVALTRHIDRIHAVLF